VAARDGRNCGRSWGWRGWWWCCVAGRLAEVVMVRVVAVVVAVLLESVADRGGAGPRGPRSTRRAPAEQEMAGRGILCCNCVGEVPRC
jgi:hypothetical protein